MTQINLPPTPDLPPIPNRGFSRDTAQHAAPSRDRLIVSRSMPRDTTQQEPDSILDHICRLLCSEITNHASRHEVEDTRDQAAYRVGWHDAIHSLRHLILSRDQSFAARLSIDGVPMAPEFHRGVSLSDATNMLMFAPQPFTMTTASSSISSEASKKKEPQTSLFSSAGLFSPVSVHSRRPDGPCAISTRSLNEDVLSDRSSFNSSNSSSTPLNTPSSSALSSPINSALGDKHPAPRGTYKTSRLNKSKVLKDIDTNKLLMLYEREARLSEHRIVAELARSNILRQSILQDRFFGNVPAFDPDAPEVKEFGAEINEPFVGASQQERTVQYARLRFVDWSLNEPSYESVLQPSSNHPPEKKKQPRTRPTSVFASTSDIFGSSGTCGTGSRESSTGLFGGRSPPTPGPSVAGSVFRSNCLYGGPSSLLSGTYGASSSNPPTGGLFGGLSTPFPARRDTPRKTEFGTSGVGSSTSSTGGLFGNLSVKAGTSGVSSGSSSTGGLFGRPSAPTPTRSTTSPQVDMSTWGVDSSGSPIGVDCVDWESPIAPLPAHYNPAKDTDVEREIRAESIVCGPTIRVRTDMFDRETFARSLLPHLPTIGWCRPRPVPRPLWERGPLRSDLEAFGTPEWEKNCREILAAEKEDLLSRSRARPLTTDTPERVSSFGETRQDGFAHRGSGSISVSSTPILGNVANSDAAASPKPVELPASTRFDRRTPLPEPDSADYAASSVKPLFSQITPSDAPKSPSSHALRSRRGEFGVNPLISLQTVTRPLPSQRPVAPAPASRYSPSITRSELPPAGNSPPTSLLDVAQSSLSLFQMPGQFPIQQDIRPVPLVQVPSKQSEEKNGELPKIVLTSADSSDEEEEEEEDL